nr:serine/arginine repetitive matrix protein 1-like [Aegilops tauschii subsp. strangulata]
MFEAWRRPKLFPDAMDGRTHRRVPRARPILAPEASLATSPFPQRKSRASAFSAAVCIPPERIERSCSSRAVPSCRLLPRRARPAPLLPAPPRLPPSRPPPLQLRRRPSPPPRRRCASPQPPSSAATQRRRPWSSCLRCRPFARPPHFISTLIRCRRGPLSPSLSGLPACKRRHPLVVSYRSSAASPSVRARETSACLHPLHRGAAPLRAR